MKRKAASKSHGPAYELFDDPRKPFFVYANNVLAIATLVSVATIALETVPSLQQYRPLFLVIEWGAVLLFGTEYIARIVTSKNKLGYIFSFFGIIDLIAILPSLIGLSNLTFLKSVRVIRIIRLLRMLRLAKFSRARNKEQTARSLQKINLEIYILSFALAVLVLGSLFYVFESHAEAASIPHGMYWAFKAILGGLPYPEPETIGGNVTLILSRFTAMILLGMMLSLVGSMLHRLLTGSDKD